MRDYHINIFFSEEDDCYIADIPDLKYCSASGPSPGVALAAVMEARDEWIAAAKENNLAVPEPKYRPVIYQVAG
jgi:predicted RNase H-like HicB family nuclease